MKDNFVDDCYDCSSEIDEIAGALSEISYCLSQIGNPILAASLFSHSENLNLCSEKIRKICSNKVDKDLKDIQEANGNMIKTALNVASKKN